MVVKNPLEEQVAQLNEKVRQQAKEINELYFKLDMSVDAAESNKRPEQKQKSIQTDDPTKIRESPVVKDSTVENSTD